jgi:hypothetical protein
MFITKRSPSLSMVVLVLVTVIALQGEISYSTTFGGLERLTTETRRVLAVGWLIFRGALIVALVTLWILDRKRSLFRVIIIVTGALTIGLLLNMVSLLTVLVGFSAQDIKSLLIDVVLMAVTNILIFSIWYWVIDPPGVEDIQREDAPWDFLFPQRVQRLPYYDTWSPRYTDYLYVAFTTSFAFSPTDAMPLTRRAKLLMLLQAAVSIVTLTGIASSAINIMAGSA